jgi:DNA polymerase III subunit beta
MRFKIQTDIFKKAIESASHASSTNNLTPILENILIDARYKKLILTGNNLEMAIEYVIEDGVDVEVEGKFTLSAKFLTSYIALVQDSEITVELERGWSVLFQTKSSETKFKWLAAEKFPVIPAIPSNRAIRIKMADLKSAIEKTLFSTADGWLRPMLAGIYFRRESDMLVFASTDSFRLSDMRIETEPDEASSAIIIPWKTAAELSRLVHEDIPQVELFVHESQVLFVFWNIRLTSRLLSGKFPDYESFFPTEYKTKVTVLRSEFINALKQTNLVARQNNYNTRVRSNHDGNIVISTGDTEIGASSVSISGSVEWQEDIVWVNSEYLLQALSVIRDDYVSFEFKNPLSPIVLRGVASGNTKQTYRHLLMPLKI